VGRLFKPELLTKPICRHQSAVAARLDGIEGEGPQARGYTSSNWKPTPSDHNAGIVSAPVCVVEAAEVRVTLLRIA
jgi:hypothetical protein